MFSKKIFIIDVILYLPFAAIVWYNKLIALMQIKSPRTYTEQILAYDTDTSYIVCVKDNGIGFDPDKELDGMTHIGIHNIRERLSAICSGALTIESAAGAGTTATIFIPKQGKV